MTNDHDPNDQSLERIGNREFARPTTAVLVRRGLESLDSIAPQVLSFPSDRSIGSVCIGKPDPDSVELDDFQWMDARGNIQVPAGAACHLDISESGARDISPLLSLSPNSLRALLFQWETPSQAALGSDSMKECLIERRKNLRATATEALTFEPGEDENVLFGLPNGSVDKYARDNVTFSDA